MKQKQKCYLPLKGNYLSPIRHDHEKEVKDQTRSVIVWLGHEWEGFTRVTGERTLNDDGRQEWVMTCDEKCKTNK